MKFLGNILATVIGIFVFIMLTIFSVIIIGILFGGNTDKVEVKNNSVIVLDLKDVNEDYSGKYSDPWLTAFSERKKTGLMDVITAIDLAQKDNSIKGISLLNTQSTLGMAQSKELRDALERFKLTGKFVYSYANVYSQKGYYLSSVANKIFLNPVGELDFKGLSTEVMFFKDFQEKSGLKMEVIRHGKYKSAVEPFLENKMSEANKQQTTELLKSIWEAMVLDVSKSRNISIPQLNTIANGLLARTPEMAKSQGMIDQIAYEDEYHNAIRKRLKVEPKEDYNTISITEYAQNAITSEINLDANSSIAIIYAQGEIRGGEGDVTEIGEGSMRRSLKEAREDEDIKAVVLRINSPGGSALTSDLIWREVELTKKVKPVVVSMGNYAASGGYYIACSANTIFAQKNTITGSIGVFGALPNFSVAANRYGINTEQVRTHENASNYSPFVPVDEKFKAFTTEGVEQIYNTFIDHVAKGRNLTIAQVDSIGQGRVWSGSEAIKIGLVDRIGGLKEALKEAARLAKIKSYRTVDYPEYKKTFEDVFANLPFATSKSKLIIEEIGEENYRILQEVKQIKNRKGIQAVLPYELKIE